MGNQLRFFCSYEVLPNLTSDDMARGEAFVVTVLARYLIQHPDNRDRISIGAIPDVWTACIARAFCQPFSASRIHYLPLEEVPPVSAEGYAALPPGIIATDACESDIAEILSTSEVPHPPWYLKTRLAHTTVLRELLSPLPTSHSARSTQGAQAPSRIVAHCTTHRDGSIGTLHVHPTARQRGLGHRVLLERARAMAAASSAPVTSSIPTKDDNPRALKRDAPVFCYVHRENEASNALMRRAGMKIARNDGEVWWARVTLPLAPPPGWV